MEKQEQIWLLGDRDAVDSAFHLLRRQGGNHTEQLILAANRRDLWRDGSIVGLATELSDHRASLLETLRDRQQGFPPLRVQVVSLRYSQSQAGVFVDTLDGSIHQWIDTPKLSAAQAMAQAGSYLATLGDALHGEHAIPGSAIARAAWAGGEALCALQANIAWTDEDADAWWASLQDWLHMRHPLSSKWGREWSWEERRERLDGLMRMLPGMHRDLDAMEAYCFNHPAIVLAEAGKQEELEQRQQVFSCWAGPETTWQRGRMQLHFGKANSPWVMQCFSCLPQHLQYQALEDAARHWVNHKPLLPVDIELSEQLPELWRQCPHWPDWPVMLADWHQMEERMPQRTLQRLGALEAQRQQQALDEATTDPCVNRRAPRL